MTLTTHAVVGAAAARIFSSNPTIAFCAAVLSHFFIDALPHWDYKLRSAVYDDQNPMNNDMAINKDFFIDLTKIGFDALMGLVLSCAIFQPVLWSHDFWIILLGACAGILPDPLQFVYFKWRHEPMISLQRFHTWIHSDLKLDGRWLSGSVLQLAVLCMCVFASLYVTGDLRIALGVSW